MTGDATRADVEFDAAGTTLRGWFFTPATDGPHATVIMAHGFAALKEMGLEDYAERFVDAGLAVLAFDHRNFGASDGSPRFDIDPRQTGLNARNGSSRAACARAPTVPVGLDARAGPFACRPARCPRRRPARRLGSREVRRLVEVLLVEPCRARACPKALMANLRTAFAERLDGHTLVTDPLDADVAVLWLRPALSLFGDDKSGRPLPINPRDLGMDIDRIRWIEASVPSVLAVNLTKPWLLAEIEPEADAVEATYETDPANLADAMRSDRGFERRLRLTNSRDIEAVEASPRDVPGLFCGRDYAYVDRAGSTYRFGFGLTGEYRARGAVAGRGARTVPRVVEPACRRGQSSDGRGSTRKIRSCSASVT